MKKWFFLMFCCCVFILVGYIAKVAWYERYVWPSASVAGMQAPPPMDRSRWPIPAAWKIEKQIVEVATPQGLKNQEISYFVNSIDMDFIKVEPGSYSSRGNFKIDGGKANLRRAEHWQQIRFRPKITLSKAYYLGAFEVNNQQYELFAPSHKQQRPEYQQGRLGDYHPVEGITWREAQLFSQWLSQKEGRYYRLPTAAEWDYANKAGTISRFYWGEQFWDSSKANLGGLHSNLETSRYDGYKHTAPMGMFAANPWGLYDMTGNVYEWVADWWHQPPTRDVTNPTGPKNGTIRMAKGGSWATRYYAAYAEESDGNNPADLLDLRGFRVLVEIPSNN